jgi:hypothetical protein
VAEEVTQASTSGSSGRTSGRTSCKKLGPGNLGREASPPKQQAGKGKGTQRQQQPRGQQQQQQRDLDHRRVIERLNLELEVARTNARTNGTLYANVVKGTPFTKPPLPLPPVMPQPLPLPVSEDDLERHQAVDTLFTLYESQHVQMMKIKGLLCK